MHVCGCTGTTAKAVLTYLYSSLVRTHLLLAGKDTVPISTSLSTGCCFLFTVSRLMQLHYQIATGLVATARIAAV